LPFPRRRQYFRCILIIPNQSILNHQTYNISTAYVELSAWDVKRLSQEDRDESFELDNNDYWLRSQPDLMASIITTNSRPALDEYFPPEAIPWVLFLTISRINHACIPNAEYSWSKTHTDGRIHVIRDIKKGEEMTMGRDLGVLAMETQS
jgi:SET domain